MDINTSHIKDFYPNLKNTKSLLAVSGGVDSIVLAHLFFKSNFNFSIAHCNYNLRGKDNENDALLIKKLAKSFNVDLFIKKFDTIKYSKDHKFSIQMSAREIRYKWFEELLIII
jgi:tRNA(Ile)-lysidine synthase